jgi:hypothetical protein
MLQVPAIQGMVGAAVGGRTGFVSILILRP